MTGPVHVNGAKRGDALEVELLDIVPDEYGYTVIVPGFGFLRDLFPNPHIVNWQLTRIGAVSKDMPGITVPYEAFPGSIGVLPGQKEVDMWKQREADLAGAGGVVLGPDSGGALPANICGEKGKYKDDCLRTIPPRKMVEIWMFNKCKLELKLLFLVLLMVAGFLQVTFITHRVMVKYQELLLKWVP
jgi:formamidase